MGWVGVKMNDKYTLFGEEVVPVPSAAIFRWGVVALIWGWVSALIGLDAGIMAVTILTSSLLSNMGFPMGIKYLAVCVGSSLLLATVVRILL